MGSSRRDSVIVVVIVMIDLACMWSEPRGSIDQMSLCSTMAVDEFRAGMPNSDGSHQEHNTTAGGRKARDAARRSLN